MIKNNNTLVRTNEVVLHAACRLIRSGRYVDHLIPGVMLRIKRQTPFKAIASWYAPTGQGRELLLDFHTACMEEYFIVERALCRPTYWFRRPKLGKLLYLRGLTSSDAIPRDLRLLKSREVLI